MFEIEKNVPYPTPKTHKKAVRSCRGQKMTLPLLKMEVGDSCYVPVDQFSRAQVQIAAAKLGTDLNRKYSTRAEGTGCRVWRLR